MASIFTGTKQYSFTIDDCIRFCEQITTNKDTYTSIFDSPILAKIKDLHDTYGTVFLLALFYNTTGYYTSTFDLSQMTDDFKQEFIDNSDWLKLTFHSWNYITRYTDPSHVWVNGGYDFQRNLFYDYRTVRNEAIRFAGSESWLDIYPGHFYDGDKVSLKMLRDIYGVKLLHGNAIQVANVPYYLTDAQRATLNSEDAFYDTYEEFLVLLRDACIERVVGDLGGTPGQQTLDYLNNLSGDLNQILLFESHETYIHNNVVKTNEGYAHACAWCDTNSYTPQFPVYSEIKPYFNKGPAFITPHPRVLENGQWVSATRRLFENGQWIVPTVRQYV